MLKAERVLTKLAIVILIIVSILLSANQIGSLPILSDNSTSSKPPPPADGGEPPCLLNGVGSPSNDPVTPQ